ncbi:hypothetical protein [Microbacterium sp. p3-SID336]|uniref:hypothetical protein n=1 Tax=Microbacterium sp. p3-SID336 TaxID=2916212 RepID=UPI0021A5DAD4|nr:hypothetical protein [Microbacterium sp. p3-SID336]MCT1479862.1 hypothetical protein [Microbacterium sp. p3-SID336]
MSTLLTVAFLAMGALLVTSATVVAIHRGRVGRNVKAAGMTGRLALPASGVGLGVSLIQFLVAIGCFLLAFSLPQRLGDGRDEASLVRLLEMMSPWGEVLTAGAVVVGLAMSITGAIFLSRCWAHRGTWQTDRGLSGLPRLDRRLLYGRSGLLLVGVVVFVGGVLLLFSTIA